MRGRCPSAERQGQRTAPRARACRHVEALLEPQGPVGVPSRRPRGVVDATPSRRVVRPSRRAQRARIAEAGEAKTKVRGPRGDVAPAARSSRRGAGPGCAPEDRPRGSRARYCPGRPRSGHVRPAARLRNRAPRPPSAARWAAPASNQATVSAASSRNADGQPRRPGPTPKRRGARPRAPVTPVTPGSHAAAGSGAIAASASALRDLPIGEFISVSFSRGRGSADIGAPGRLALAQA